MTEPVLNARRVRGRARLRERHGKGHQPRKPSQTDFGPPTQIVHVRKSLNTACTAPAVLMSLVRFALSDANHSEGHPFTSISRGLSELIGSRMHNERASDD